MESQSERSVRDKLQHALKVILVKNKTITELHSSLQDLRDKYQDMRNRNSKLATDNARLRTLCASLREKNSMIPIYSPPFQCAATALATSTTTAERMCAEQQAVVSLSVSHSALNTAERKFTSVLQEFFSFDTDTTGDNKLKRLLTPTATPVVTHFKKPNLVSRKCVSSTPLDGNVELTRISNQTTSPSHKKKMKKGSEGAYENHCMEQQQLQNVHQTPLPVSHHHRGFVVKEDSPGVTPHQTHSITSPTPTRNIEYRSVLQTLDIKNKKIQKKPTAADSMPVKRKQ
jgi:hypothetical protein